MEKNKEIKKEVVKHMPDNMKGMYIPGVEITKYNYLRKNRDESYINFISCDLALISYGGNIGKNITGKEFIGGEDDEMYISVKHPMKEEILNILSSDDLLEKIGYYRNETGSITNWCIYLLLSKELNLKLEKKVVKKEKKDSDRSDKLNIKILLKRIKTKESNDFICLKIKYYLFGDKESVYVYKQDGKELKEVSFKFDFKDEEYDEYKLIRCKMYWHRSIVLGVFKNNIFKNVGEVNLNTIIGYLDRVSEIEILYDEDKKTNTNDDELFDGEI